MPEEMAGYVSTTVAQVAEFFDVRGGPAPPAGRAGRGRLPTAPHHRRWRGGGGVGHHPAWLERVGRAAAHRLPSRPAGHRAVWRAWLRLGRPLPVAELGPGGAGQRRADWPARRPGALRQQRGGGGALSAAPRPQPQPGRQRAGSLRAAAGGGACPGGAAPGSAGGAGPPAAGGGARRRARSVSRPALRIPAGAGCCPRRVADGAGTARGCGCHSRRGGGGERAANGRGGGAAFVGADDRATWLPWRRRCARGATRN